MILKVDFSVQDAIIRADFNEVNSKFKADFGQVYRIVSDEVPVYDGSYSVTPAVTEQTMETANKMMTDNVKVEKIPYSEVSNNSGGFTVTIAN